MISLPSRPDGVRMASRTVCAGRTTRQGGFRGHITYLASVKAVRSPVTIGCEDRFGFGRCQAAPLRQAASGLLLAATASLGFLLSAGSTPVAPAVLVHGPRAGRNGRARFLKQPPFLLGLAVDSELESVPALKESVRVVQWSSGQVRGEGKQGREGERGRANDRTGPLSSRATAPGGGVLWWARAITGTMAGTTADRMTGTAAGTTTGTTADTAADADTTAGTIAGTTAGTMTGAMTGYSR